MQYIHHVQVDAKTFPKLKEFISDHREHIIRHSVGFLGKAYLIFADIDLRDALRARGFESRVTHERADNTTNVTRRGSARMAEQQRAFRIEFVPKEEIQREARWLSPELQEIAEAMERVARGEHEAMRIVIEDKELREQMARRIKGLAWARSLNVAVRVTVTGVGVWREQLYEVDVDD